jgi:LacI family transcriptional regulator
LTPTIQVEDVIQHVALSRRDVEFRFQTCLGRTLHAELQRIRMERARRFPLETDLPIPRVAEAVGYSTPSYLIQVIRKEHDLTPAKYRRKLRDDTS